MSHYLSGKCEKFKPVDWRFYFYNSLSNKKNNSILEIFLYTIFSLVNLHEF